jgi:heterodisulfide reductase subunit C
MTEMRTIDSSFLEEVKKRSGEDLSLCYQCLKCTAGCPTAPYMDIRPNTIIRMIQMGMKKEVLGSSAIWFCVYCQTCGTRCPNKIHIGVLMDALREMAMEEGIAAKEKNIHLFHEAFIQSVRRGGRAPQEQRPNDRLTFSWRETLFEGEISFASQLCQGERGDQKDL